MKQIYTFTRSDMFSSNCYLLLSGDECAVVDPSVSEEELRLKIPALPKIKYVILTHEHLDHLWEIDTYEGAEVLVSEKCGEALSNNRKNGAFMLGGPIDGYYGSFTVVSNGEIITIGEEKLRVLLTTGHSEGSVVLLGDGYAFVGDTIFAHGGYGRYDLPGGDLTSLKQSLKMILSLDDNTVIYPGHGDITTISETKQYF